MSTARRPTRRQHGKEISPQRLARLAFLFSISHATTADRRSFFQELDANADVLAACRLGNGDAMRRFLESWNLDTPWLGLFVWNHARGKTPPGAIRLPSAMPRDGGRSTVVRDVCWLVDLTQGASSIATIASRADVDDETVKKGLQRARRLLMLPGSGRPRGRLETKRRNVADRG